MECDLLLVECRSGLFVAVPLNIQNINCEN